MVDIVRFRKEFTIFIIDRDASVAISLAATLKSVGFERVRFYPTLASAEAMIHTEAPHILIIDHDGFSQTADQHVEKFLIDVKSLSPDILTILSVTNKKVLDGFQFVGRALAFDTITKPFASTLELVQKIDRACLGLYYKFENEQLREQVDEGQNLTPAHGDVASAYRTEQSKSEFEILDQTLERLTATKDLDQTVQIFIDALGRASGHTPVAYFKYVPSHMSLLFAQSAWLPNERYRGLGLDLKKEAGEQIHLLLENPAMMDSLHDMVQTVFNKQKFTAFTHSNEGEALGVFIVLDEADFERMLPFNILRRAFEIAYKRNLTIKEKHSLDLSDSLTGLPSRRQFLLRLEQEMARSRRIFMPVSLITMRLDGYAGFASRLGQQQADSILKTVGLILKKTTRLNDVLARIGTDEFGCLLPHTGHKGAAIKAERLRILMESSKIPLLEGLGLGAARISCGVSEYPSFCGDGDGLIHSADEALDQIRKQGGNKVCLASAPRGFKMDFTPRLTDDSSKFAPTSETRSAHESPGE